MSSEIQHCRDITDDRINEAIESREDARALFERAAEVAKPREAGARILLLFAKLASPDCDWLEGALRVELTADGDKTVIESLVDIGAGLKERVFPKRTVDVPLTEFLAAIKKFPTAIAPLTAESSHAGRLLLVAGEVEKHYDDEEETKKPVPLTMADLPAIGKKPATQPPPGTGHSTATVVGAPAAPLPLMKTALAPPVAGAKPLAKLQLRKSPIARGVTEVNTSKKKKSSAPPPRAKPEDVDKGWEE